MVFGNHMEVKRFLIEGENLNLLTEHLRDYLSSEENYEYPFKSDRIKIFFKYKHHFWAKALVLTTFILETKNNKQVKFEMISAYNWHIKKAVKWLKETCYIKRWDLKEI